MSKQVTEDIWRSVALKQNKRYNADSTMTREEFIKLVPKIFKKLEKKDKKSIFAVDHVKIKRD